MRSHTLIPLRVTDEIRSIIRVSDYTSLRSTEMVTQAKMKLYISRNKARVWTIEGKGIMKEVSITTRLRSLRKLRLAL